jgi:hypothetical protein
MPKSESFTTLAIGPVFRRNGESTRLERILLLERLDPDSASSEYHVACRTFDGVEGTKIARRVRTRRFTTAVRFFCDYVLDQATEHDRTADAR